MIRKYVLYKRQNVNKPGDSYGVEVHSRGFEPKVIAIAKTLEDLAQEVFSDRKNKIRLQDRLVTLNSPILIPGNRYIDKPVSSEEIVSFFRLYEGLSNH